MIPVKNKVFNDLQYVFDLNDTVNSHVRKQAWDYIEKPIKQHVNNHVLSTIWATVKNKNRMR